jgi:periplasmic protein TonB
MKLWGLHFRPPAFYTRMDRQSQVMTLALTASLVLHAVFLSIQFSFPIDHLFDAVQPLDVVLVNSKSATKPFYADAHAQANLDGGGNTDKKRRAKTPLPALNRTEAGDALTQTTARQRQLEAEQQRLIAALRSANAVLPSVRSNPSDTPPQPQPGNDLTTNALAIAKLEAQIAHQVEEYQQRPRKVFLGARASEYKYAQYLEDWRIKVERIGTQNYPEAAKGLANASLQLTVLIRPNGTIDNIQIDRSSGNQQLDDAARRIVRMGAPYAVFPANFKEADILVITKTWTFLPGDRVVTE